MKNEPVHAWTKVGLPVCLKDPHSDKAFRLLREACHARRPYKECFAGTYLTDAESQEAERNLFRMS